MSVNNSHSGVSMRLLLLNNNPAVSRLIKLSAEKAGYELDEFEDYGLVPLTTYDVILVDNELYDEIALSELCGHIGCDYIVYICQRGAKKPDTVNVALEKPFLPTDFLVLLDKVKNVIESQQADITEENEDDTSLSTSQATELADAFDIDQIDTLETEDDMLPINLLEEADDDFKDEEDEDISEKLSLDDLALDDLSLDDSSDEESLDNKLVANDEFSFDEIAPLEKEDAAPLEDFDFEEEEHVSSTADEIESKEVLEESVNPSVLDKDDINEVKQLLDESEEQEEEEEISELSLDALELNKEEDAGKFFFEDDALKEEELLEEDTLDLELDDNDDLKFEDLSLSLDTPEALEEEANVEAEIPENQEEIIDDFAEEIDEKIEEEKEQALEEEQLLPKANISFDDMESDDIDSLDDLNENMLKHAFGEELDEEDTPTLTVPTQKEKNQEIEVIRDEIESSIAKSISSLAQSDILREALKGMRLNITITFDEKEQV